MSSTHLSLHYHLIFGTKNHAPLITPVWRDRLHAYLGGVIRTLDGVPDTIDGVADHVHLLIGLQATHTLADVLRETKSVSSAWVHEEIGVAFCVAGRIWRFYRKPLAIGERPRLHPEPGGASSDTHLPGGIFGAPSTQWSGIR